MWSNGRGRGEKPGQSRNAMFISVTCDGKVNARLVGIGCGTFRNQVGLHSEIGGKR